MKFYFLWSVAFFFISVLSYRVLGYVAQNLPLCLNVKNSVFIGQKKKYITVKLKRL